MNTFEEYQKLVFERDQLQIECDREKRRIEKEYYLKIASLTAQMKKLVRWEELHQLGFFQFCICEVAYKLDGKIETDIVFVTDCSIEDNTLVVIDLSDPFYLHPDTNRKEIFQYNVYVNRFNLLGSWEDYF